MQIFLILLGLLLILFNIRFIKNGTSTTVSIRPGKAWPYKLLNRKSGAGSVSYAKSDTSTTGSGGFSGILEQETAALTDVDLRIGELRREFSETLVELQREIIDLNDKLELFQEAQSSAEIIDTVNIADADLELARDTFEQASQLETGNRTLSKTDEVGLLLKKGYSIEEICEKLQIGRGEVLLIKKLYQ